MRFEHKFQEDFSEVESKGCLRCKNYQGYGFYKIKDLPDGKVVWGIKVYCKLAECVPDLKPIRCNYCGCEDFEKAVQKIEDEELKKHLLQLTMCPNCHEDWRGECFCLLCHFDYPNSSIPGKRGNYCFCKGCEWNDQCPEKRKSFPDCEEMREIEESKVEKITQLI